MKPSRKIDGCPQSISKNASKEAAHRKSNSDWSDFSDEFECDSLMEGILPSLQVRMAHSRKLFLPPTDIIEMEMEYCIRIEIAGLRTGQYTLEWKGYDLKIHGYREETPSPAPSRYHQFEILYGAFERIIRMPQNVDQHNTKAQYQDGILEITVPKSNSGKTIQIPVISED